MSSAAITTPMRTMMAVTRKEDTACWRKCFSQSANTIHTAPVAPNSSVVGDTGAVAVSGAPSFAPPKVHGKISNVLLSTVHHNNVAYRPASLSRSRFDMHILRRPSPALLIRTCLTLSTMNLAAGRHRQGLRWPAAAPAGPESSGTCRTS